MCAWLGSGLGRSSSIALQIQKTLFCFTDEEIYKTLTKSRARKVCVIEVMDVLSHKFIAD